MKFLIKAIFFSLLITINGFVLAKQIIKKSNEVKMINISTLVKFHKDDLVFKTKAYVSYIYSCPSCPTDTVCKPCMDSNFIISEKKKIRFDYLGLGSDEMIVFTDKKFSIELGKNYFFYLKLRPIKSLQNDQNIWSGDLISVLEDIKI